MNIWDFSDETAKTGDLKQNLTELLEYIRTMPAGDLRLIMEVTTAELAVSLGVMTRMDVLMNTLKGLVDEDKEQSEGKS